jgi:hypothetical protein
MMKQIKKVCLFTMLAIFSGACVVNVEERVPAPVAGERLVTLALVVPGPPASRGLDDDDEDEIKTIDVLLFTTDDDYFYYRAIGDIDPVSKKNFTVKLPGGPWNVVVLANARGALDNPVYAYKSLLSPAAPAATNVSRANVLDGLVLQLQDKTEKWPEGNFEGIPMWGYCNLTINASTGSPAASISLTRAIARVNVSVDNDDDPEAPDVNEVFSLASVRL